MNVYQVRAKRAFANEQWVVVAPSLVVAVEKVQKKLKRAPRLYEGYEIVEAELVIGVFLK